MDKYGTALHHSVVDHELVLKGRLLTVDRFGVEFGLSKLSEKFWRPAQAMQV